MNTPRLVANSAGQTVWRWDQLEPFGNNPADENPSGLGAFDLPLRLPGQYYDKETNLHYNYSRDYDPNIGRYVESDPIGLAGGLNTYLYVAADPLFWIDPRGLNVYGSGGVICPNPRQCIDSPFEPTPEGPKISPQPPKGPKAPKQPGGVSDCAERSTLAVECDGCCEAQAKRSLYAGVLVNLCKEQCGKKDFPDRPSITQRQPILSCRPS